MWENSLNTVGSDNNKILYESLLDFFYSETVLTFSISLVTYSMDKVMTLSVTQSELHITVKCE